MNVTHIHTQTLWCFLRAFNRVLNCCQLLLVIIRLAILLNEMLGEAWLQSYSTHMYGYLCICMEFLRNIPMHVISVQQRLRKNTKLLAYFHSRSHDPMCYLNFFINLRRNKNSWCSYLTHKGYSTNIVGWLNDFTLGSDTSYLPLLGPSFLSTNGNNHTYPVGSWCRLRWKAFQGKACCEYKTLGWRRWPTLASSCAHQIPAVTRQIFQGNAQPPSILISPGTHVLLCSQVVLSALPRVGSASFVLWLLPGFFPGMNF